MVPVWRNPPHVRVMTSKPGMLYTTVLACFSSIALHTCYMLSLIEVLFLEFKTYYTKLRSGMQYHCLLTNTEKYMRDENIYHLSWVIKFLVWSNILCFNQSDMYVQFLLKFPNE